MYKQCEHCGATLSGDYKYLGYCKQHAYMVDHECDLGVSYEEEQIRQAVRRQGYISKRNDWGSDE